MFDFLVHKKTISHKTNEKSEVTIKAEPPVEEKKLTVESFIKKISYRGKNVTHFAQKFLSAIAKEKEISHGVFFIAGNNEKINFLRFLSGYACEEPENIEAIIPFGEGFTGQVAKDGKLMILTDIPEGYISIGSGLGKAAPASLIIFPLKNENNVLAVVELASFHRFTDEDKQFFEDLSVAVAEQLLKFMEK